MVCYLVYTSPYMGDVPEVLGIFTVATKAIELAEKYASRYKQDVVRIAIYEGAEHLGYLIF